MSSAEVIPVKTLGGESWRLEVNSEKLPWKERFLLNGESPTYCYECSRATYLFEDVVLKTPYPYKSDSKREYCRHQNVCEALTLHEVKGTALEEHFPSLIWISRCTTYLIVSRVKNACRFPQSESLEERDVLKAKARDLGESVNLGDMFPGNYAFVGDKPVILDAGLRREPLSLIYTKFHNMRKAFAEND